MLKFFTRLEKTRNFVILIFAILMVASLVLFYAPTQSGVQTNLGRSTETVASVSGEKITVGELIRQKESYSRFSQGRGFPSKMILEGLIGTRIVRVEAERLGLTASDAEVAAEIRSQFKPEEGKPFDQKIYEQNVIDQFGSITAYETSVRDDISSKKLDAFLTSGVTVSEEELLTDFQRKNTKFDLSYVAVSSAELAQTLKPTDEELKAYFEKNKASYYISVPQKKIKYIFVNTAKIGEKLPITDAELRAEYDKLPADKKIGGVNGQEIVLRVAKPEFESKVQEKAAELITRLKKDGDSVSEAVFAEVARGFSEDPISAQSGGKLRGPVRENLNKPEDPYQRLIKMKPGDVTEPISYQGRYFILRRGEDVPKSFEDAKKEIEVSLRNRKAYAVAAELAQKIADALKQSKDVQKTAAQFAGEANMNVAEMIKETSYIKPGDDVPNIGTSPQFEEGIASLEKVGDVGEKTPIQNGFAIPTLADRKEPRDAEFDEVKAQILDVVKLDQARTKVEEIAKQIASGAASADALAGAAIAKGMKAKDQKAFIIGSPLGDGPSASTSEALEDAVYAMKSGEVTKTPIKIGDNWYVVGVTKRDDANTADFAKQRSSLLEQMLSKKRTAVFSDYLAATKKRLQDNGSIVIYKEVLAKTDEPEPGSVPANIPAQ
ncbi:MAG TPA: peptidyl-prolyl cis-trans isomerase [Pyrinomonadaceae bacterium]|nr:peptidyl-prolyl cis-trans isomerase [Chloracidobacterium sp.]MBP9934364.1 peptidyl-prolyl cis-trans isomerase [Pyrinomonadaceae bacterium]MBK9436759.1 peptidyl-prolyl cis-trans isomerase [Chloracidobacterium sp.]MBL0241750.1 peptidyl-prolyl cis-trans isomerase [Chloracidobacterium sp.]HQX56455.1 peptidyl-prolyl cis-trans isomerase [Pyrinomonadaceae bacterium]